MFSKKDHSNIIVNIIVLISKRAFHDEQKNIFEKYLKYNQIMKRDTWCKILYYIY